ncbi:MAG TPA: tetratricopeptide repeat protein, partial [Bacteroidota bacterium]|nr:tetratricopeptide repeat protein [Bacteroidota bacterium]
MTTLGARSVACAFALWAASISGCGSPAEQGKIPLTTKSEDARREYLVGRDLAEGLQFHNSVAHFEQAIALDPGFASAELGRANAATTAEEFLEHLKKASSLTSGISLGERLSILATEAGANGQTDVQKSLLDSLVAAYPRDERAQTLLGTYYFGILDYAHAVEHLKAATAIAPKFAPAYNLLGYSYRFMENYPEAEAAFKTYTELIPTEANPYDSYGELLLQEGKFDQSIQTYRQALAKDSTFISSKQGVAFSLLYQGKADEAGAELEKMSSSARDDGEHRQAFFDMAVYHAYRGNLGSAAADIDK